MTPESSGRPKAPTIVQEAPSLFETATGVEDEEIGTDESITEPFDPTLIRVTTKNLTIDLFIARLKQDEFNLAPDFQRKAGIWTPGAQSRLIESMLIRIPLPAFYIDASDDEKWVVVDGLQRLTALKNFIVDETLALVDLEFLRNLETKTFSELPRNFQRRIAETQVTVYLIDPGTPPEVKFNIFKRINTGGLPLSLQEIRHALNQGPVTTFLKELATSPEFAVATAGSIRDDRMADREFVLRFLAFVMTSYSDYRSKDFDSFLNDRMAEINRMGPGERNQLAASFKRAMIAAADVFGNDAFRKRYNREHGRYPVNKALFETWAVNLNALSDEELEIVITRRQRVQALFMSRLQKGNDFDSAVSTATGDIRKVRLRFEVVKEILREVLNGSDGSSTFEF
jgi:Protein of unknown function DUF262